MIPVPVIALIARLFDSHYTRSQFENLFYETGTSVDSPGGNKVDTVTYWLRAINKKEPERSLEIFGKLIEDFMGREAWAGTTFAEDQEAVHAALQKHGLRYATGGKIIHSAFGPGSSTASLQGLLKRKDFPAVRDEFSRATENVEVKPREALSAAANILEAICREYIVQHSGLQMPNKPDLQSMFGVVRKHLGFDPGAIEDGDLKGILSGLITVVNGIGALRTHASSAHSQGTSKRIYKLTPRHARLAIHGAHAVASFLLETWEERDKRPSVTRIS